MKFKMIWLDNQWEKIKPFGISSYFAPGREEIRSFHKISFKLQNS